METHAIVIRAGEPVVASRLEVRRGLRSEPLEVIPEAWHANFSQWARADLAKYHTVEHDVPVREIGHLTRESNVFLLKWWIEAMQLPEEVLDQLRNRRSPQQNRIASSQNETSHSRPNRPTESDDESDRSNTTTLPTTSQRTQGSRRDDSPSPERGARRRRQ